MRENALPHYDDSINTTGCCPRFNPEGWDGRELHLRELPVVRAETVSAMHVPLNMGKVFARVHGHIQDAGGYVPGQFVVLSRDTSAWHSEHLFAVGKPVPGEEMTTLSGDYATKVFEGPYSDAREWAAELHRISAARGKPAGKAWFFYTTCPKCAKAYGHNYVVGLAEV